MDRIARVPDHERGSLDQRSLGARRRGAPEEEALDHGGRGARVLPDPVEAGVDQGVRAARDQPRDARHRSRDRRAEGQVDEQRGEGERAGEQRVVQDRHLDDRPAQPIGLARHHVERDVRPERGAADHGVVQLEVVHQGDHLVAEQRHRVARHVLRPVGLPVAQEIEHVDAASALGERLGQRAVHLAAQQQPREQHQRPRPGSVLVVDQAEALVAEFARGRHEPAP